jgi:hypothetical protein
VSQAIEDSAPADSTSDESQHAVPRLRAKRAELDQRIREMQQKRDSRIGDIEAASQEKKQRDKTVSAHKWPEEEEENEEKGNRRSGLRRGNIG